MLNQSLRSQIDKIWTTFWSGGISNPLTVIEQITYLLFIRRLDELQTLKERKATLLGTSVEDPIYQIDDQPLRWGVFKDMDAESMFELFRKVDGVFDFMKNKGASKDSSFNKYMKGATFMIPTPRLLQLVVDLLSAVDMNDRDTKGDVYEYLLSKIASAGTNGQFRTPRHIIRMMVEMTNPGPEDVICDPSAGTSGFLVKAAEYILEKHPNLLTNAEMRKHYENDMFMGMEFDATMIRIGAMNLLLHGIENPQLVDVDALSEANSSFRNKATLILANPPFKGSLDHDSVDGSLSSVVKTTKTELLFLALILRGLKVGGRAAVIVPDGVLFGSSNAHKQIRKEILDNNQLTGVISMPSGVFKPYAGVSTAVLFFTKTGAGGTDKVWFYDMKADGLSLDDKRQPVAENNIPDIIARWNNRHAESNRLRTEQSFFVPHAEIHAAGYDLSINRYKEVEHEEKIYDVPEVIIERITELDKERSEMMTELKALLQQQNATV
ncbi:type I restriction-modification system subunit M [Mucilaginibacter aquaedulcis]|uniref:type I restriction-modification system subunit M n=1 Tax=Mucilaginibacter aquaedulcis TaxID=1187081 RepID=UPI0025B62733|nr:class I SAM-dependent DNA methyltransferase [Mucilaginibacter aquaedulcis]MDN3551269.1 class I SAM-dependent DNA methyltransferase [Mucilaginibacter aquaedulcis]